MRTVNYYPQGDTEGWVTIAGEDAGEENHCLRYQLFLAEPLNSHNPFLKKYADDHDRRMPADGFFRLAQVLNGNGAMTPALVQQAFVDVVVPGANIADYFASPVIQNKLDPARLASQLGDSSTLLILNPSRLTSDQPIVPESESVILFSIDSKQKSVLTIIGSDGFVAESEVVRHRSVRSAGDPSVANRYEIMASLPGWIGGTTTLSVGNRTGTLDVLIKTDGDFGMDFLDNLSNTGNLLTDMAKYLFKYLESASPSDGYETKWRRIYALEEELYREDYDWLNIDGEPRDYMSLVLLTARFINNSHKWWLKPESVNLFLILNEYEDIPNRNVGYSRPAIQLCLTNSEMSYAIVQELYTPLSPPSNILNCFTGIANTPFGDIPGMPDWFGGEVTLTTGVRTGTFTVFIKNDDSPFGEQMQNSLCTDNDRIRGAARYLFAKLEGTSDVDPGFLSTPSWLVSGSDSSIDVVRHVTDFNINDDLKDHEILNPMLDSRLHYELVDQEKPVTALHKVRLKMVMVLNESSSSFGMNLKTITRKGKSLGYGRPAVSLLIGTTERNNFHKGTNRTTEYIIEQYRGCKNIYINGGFNLDFLVSDIYADGWFSPSLKISISDTVKMTVTGHLSSSSDLRKSRLTSTELIQTAVQNLHTFVTTTPDDTSSFIQIPNFSDKLLMSIKNDERPISLDQGGIINRLILYAGNTPVFGKPLAAVVVDMNSSVYDNAISFIFYSRLKIIPPPGKTVTSFC
ncbi:hypothetical protein [Endozoicomonas sp.]|uniref:hypothetical protein n=1 Tax=Endozoicomonas sp. TaxID=1892382 RepID=UPI00383B09C1